MTTTKKIKVLECIRQGQIGGGESHLLSLVENLDRTKYDPIVLSFTDGPMVDRLKEMEVPTHVIKSTKAFDFNIWKKVKCRFWIIYDKSRNIFHQIKNQVAPFPKFFNHKLVFRIRSF